MINLLSNFIDNPLENLIYLLIIDRLNFVLFVDFIELLK